MFDFNAPSQVDSGWYEIDDIEDIGEPIRWGFGAGCAFFQDSCLIAGDPPTVPEVYSPMWCNGVDQQGCTADGYSKAICFADEMDNRIRDSNFRYFSDNNRIGGSLYSDYCPHFDGSNYEICMDSSNSVDSTINGVFQYVNQSDSRCIQGNLTTQENQIWNTSNQTGYCMKVKCLDYNSDLNQFDAIQITASALNHATVNIECSREEGRNGSTYKTVDGYTGALLCPNIDYYCPIQNSTNCFHGYFSQTRGQCICSPGYSGKKCEEVDSELLPNAKEGKPTTNSATVMQLGFQTLLFIALRCALLIVNM